MRAHIRALLAKTNQKQESNKKTQTKHIEKNKAIVRVCSAGMNSVVYRT